MPTAFHPPRGVTVASASAPAFRPARARSGGRALALSAALAASTLALTGCVGLGDPVEIDAADFPVNLERAQTATLQITAQGAFYEPGTSVPYDGGWFGSGFIIDRSGLAVTNNHVAAGATSFEIRPGGGTGPAIDATVVSTSECLDLAVLQLPEGETYPFMAWRDGDISPALEVYSAGFPNGTPNFTLTGGIVNTANQAIEFNWASVDLAIEHDARIRGTRRDLNPARALHPALGRRFFPVARVVRAPRCSRGRRCRRPCKRARSPCRPRSSCARTRRTAYRAASRHPR